MKKSNRVKLYTPLIEELSYRMMILNDEDTMSYNKNCEIFSGYDPETGCIDFNESKWKEWFLKWVNNDNDRYYAYIIKSDENTPIGDVALYYDYEKEGYCISIVIEYKHRGYGYSEDALGLLLEVAFNDLNAKKVFDNFPESRVSAEKLFNKLGFKRVSEDIVELTQNDYKNFN